MLKLSIFVWMSGYMKQVKIGKTAQQNVVSVSPLWKNPIATRFSENTKGSDQYFLIVSEAVFRRPKYI